jgi:hypothetical protein
MIKKDETLRNGYKDKKHLALIASMPCIACKVSGKNQTMITEVHHLTGCGLGLKASDLLTIPLCIFHHRMGNKGEAVHSGVKSFERVFGTQQELLKKVREML